MTVPLLHQELISLIEIMGSRGLEMRGSRVRLQASNLGFQQLVNSLSPPLDSIQKYSSALTMIASPVGEI